MRSSTCTSGKGEVSEDRGRLKLNSLDKVITGVESLMTVAIEQFYLPGRNSLRSSGTQLTLQRNMSPQLYGTKNNSGKKTT
jgi:hypothetical protein